MLLGMPCVASNVGGTSDMIKDDDVMLIDALNITSKLDKPLILSRRGQQNIICEKINRIREQQKSSNSLYTCKRHNGGYLHTLRRGL